MSRARLVFDSARTGLPPGLRAVAGPDRSLLFSDGEVAVDVLLLPPTGGLHVLQGQVLAEDGSRPTAGARVSVGPDGAAVEADGYGQFSLSDLQPFEGRTLRARMNGRSVECAVPTTKEATP